VLIGCLPVGIKAVYDESGFAAKANFGPFSYTLYPKEEKKKKEVKPVAKAQPAKAAPKEEKGGKADTFILLLKQLPDFLSDLRRKLRVKHIQLRYTMAGGDPADLALNYGKAWAAIGNLWPLLERFFVIKKRDVSVLCDFEGSESIILARLHISITLGRALGLACKYGWRILRQMLNNNKGGANNE
jgi:hypothetical protein